MMSELVRNQQGMQGAYRLLKWQLVMTLVLTALMAGLIGRAAAWSACLGGLVSILPQAYFARQLFKHHGAQAAKQIVKSFYRGEALKFLITLALFAVVFKFFKPLPVVFFVVYIVVQMLIWFAPLIFSNKK